MFLNVFFISVIKLNSHRQDFNPNDHSSYDEANNLLVPERHANNKLLIFALS